MQQTDEEHPLSISEIITYFGENDIVTDRRTVKADAELLAALALTENRVALRTTRHKNTPKKRLIRFIVDQPFFGSYFFSRTIVSSLPPFSKKYSSVVSTA